MSKRDAMYRERTGPRAGEVAPKPRKPTKVEVRALYLAFSRMAFGLPTWFEGWPLGMRARSIESCVLRGWLKTRLRPLTPDERESDRRRRRPGIATAVYQWQITKAGREFITP